MNSSKISSRYQLSTPDDFFLGVDKSILEDESSKKTNPLIRMRKFTLDIEFSFSVKFSEHRNLLHSKNRVVNFTTAKTYTVRVQKSMEFKTIFILTFNGPSFKSWNSRERYTQKKSSEILLQQRM
jgi:hypothetical protein